MANLTDKPPRHRKRQRRQRRIGGL